MEVVSCSMFPKTSNAWLINRYLIIKTLSQYMQNMVQTDVSILVGVIYKHPHSFAVYCLHPTYS